MEGMVVLVEWCMLMREKQTETEDGSRELLC